MAIEFIDPISWEYSSPYYALAFAGGYLLGSIPFSYLVTRAYGLGDIRAIGSGNVGATNVLRTGNKQATALALLGDAGKGLAAVLIGKQFGDAITLFAVLGTFIGHVFPVWLRFQGGKGVATYSGMLLGLSWPVFLMAAATWGATAFLTRISSAAALLTALVVPVYFGLMGLGLFAGLAVVLAVLIFVTHRTNIVRLIRGVESQIGASKSSRD